MKYFNEDEYANNECSEHNISANSVSFDDYNVSASVSFDNGENQCLVGNSSLDNSSLSDSSASYSSENSMNNITSNGNSVLPIILSVDTGIDDAMAIACAIGIPHSDLQGIVATYGNVARNAAIRNTCRVLEVLDRKEIPVFAGTSCALTETHHTLDSGCPRFHGIDGLGGAYYGWCRCAESVGSSERSLDCSIAHSNACDSNTSLSPIHHDIERTFSLQHSVAESNTAHLQSENLGSVRLDTAQLSEHHNGIQFIIDSVRHYGHHLRVVAVGPLTDIALAIQQAPDIIPMLNLVIMGGALTQPGNCYDGVQETNICQDPEAANLVMQSGVNVTMVGLDVTHQVKLTRDDLLNIIALGTKTSAFFADMIDYYLTANEEIDPQFADGAPLHDPLAVAVACNPTLVELFNTNLMVELSNDGGIRGRTIGDPMRLCDARKTAHVALSVDATRAHQDIVNGLLTAIMNVH